MFHAFVDDSGSATGEKRLYLAGYIFTAEQLSEFNADWIAALAAPPVLATLHMRDCFSGWTKEQRQRKLDALIAVVEKYQPLSVECSISTLRFRELVLPYAPYDLRSPYFSCFQALVISAARLLDSYNIREQLQFVFDEQGDAGLDALLWYPVFKQLQQPEIKSLLGSPPQFLSDVGVPGLQAADMLAWHLRIVNEPNCSEMHRVNAAHMIYRHIEAPISNETLRAWGQHFATVPGIKDVQGKKGSIKKFTAQMHSEISEESLVATYDAITRRARWLRPLKTLLLCIGLKSLWQRINKRGFKVSRKR